MSHALKYGDLLDSIDQRLQSTFVEQLPDHILNAASDLHHEEIDLVNHQNNNHHNDGDDDRIQIRVSGENRDALHENDVHGGDEEKKKEEAEEVEIVNNIAEFNFDAENVKQWEQMYNNSNSNSNDNGGNIGGYEIGDNIGNIPEVDRGGVKNEEIPQSLLKATSYDKYSAVLSNLEGTLYKLIEIINSTSPDNQKKIGSISRDISLFEKNLVSTGQEINQIPDKSYRTLLINRLIDIQENVSDIHRTFGSYI